ncbi:unnamed protein product [Cylindrotheca closterium]|uniref:Uncharacterized protein n=1 Tax=Cylindrotheca closterium TaxID=2856 RepID=A0AAD2G826_9STRA|nr:unnamed protein product [Cylindrotheca closterium]
MPNGGRTNGNSRKKDGGQMDNLRGACPSHRWKDLDKLVKTLNGDEAKIKAKIEEWWDESPPVEEVWEDVSKKTAKKKLTSSAGNRGNSRSQAPGRGRGRSAPSGRGGSRDRGGRGRGGDKKTGNTQPAKAEERKKSVESNSVPVPTPSKASAPKGAWGAGAPATIEPAQKSPQPNPNDIAPPPENNPLDVGVVSQDDPTPAGISATLENSPRAKVPASGNVWATKGSAHLIRAEKPKLPAPAPTPVAPPTSHMSPPVATTPSKSVQQQEPEERAVLPESTLESGLPVVSDAGAWSKGAPKTEPLAPSTATQKPLPTTIPSVSSVEQSLPAPSEPAPASTAPVNVLNMGHWETGDTDDAQNLDFAFGSFGNDNDAMEAPPANVSLPEAPPAASKEAEAPNTTSTMSPARPPPGLSLSGMPPMPGAVMVHELENKMENATLTTQKTEKPDGKSQESNVPAPVLPSAGFSQQNYNQYGMAGIYNYNAAGNGFVGMHAPAGPVLAGGVVPQQHGKPQVGQISGPSATPSAPQAVPQQGLYGSQPPAAPTSGNTSGGESATGENAAAANGIPPGMPGAMPYANPALHYGQHQFYMGQHQGGIGYNYAYGQFGGVAQGGFGYQQVMGQSQGYGAPHYDDQSHQANTHHSGGSAGYQKGSGGGYRGRNSHHNNSQYQNQYNPQHAGYGGQPYGMGYQDHFNQRGGYGPGGMGDPYGMQQGTGGSYQSNAAHSSGNFHEDDQKAKKATRGNNANSTLQFQQQVPSGGIALQAQGSESSVAGAAGWSNQTGGWSGGGAPAWPGN